MGIRSAQYMYNDVANKFGQMTNPAVIELEPENKTVRFLWSIVPDENVYGEFGVEIVVKTDNYDRPEAHVALLPSMLRLASGEYNFDGRQVGTFYDADDIVFYVKGCMA
jgi:hypothetical protein